MQRYGGLYGKAVIVLYPDRMPQILRVKTRWSGFTGAPGYTVTHFRDFDGGTAGSDSFSTAQAQEAAHKMQVFFTAIRSLLPSAVRIDVEPEVDVLEATSGKLVDSISVAPELQVSGAATQNYAAAVGSVINWRTNGIREGRRVRGRTFLVPLSAIAFAPTGNLLTTAQTTIADAATVLRSSAGSPDLGVYARPSAPGVEDGAWFYASGSNVPTMGAVLRSRRD